MPRPVTIMFHTVGLEAYRWSFPYISESVQSFERKIAALREAGFSSVFFGKELAQAAGRKVVCLTFDDGYLDNWVHVFPILKKYGFKATIFVTVQFADPRNVVRPTKAAEDVDDNHEAERCCAGFLSWAEMREMEKSGLVDIQSHSLTHTWYFSGPRIVDFWHPGASTEEGGPVWMLWNAFPERKPFYLTEAEDTEATIPYGTPVYEHDKALAVRRFVPEEEHLSDELTRHVAVNGGREFFQKINWRDELLNIVTEHRKSRGSGSANGRYESESEYLARVSAELTESKRILEQNLDKRIDSLCWPGGGVTRRVVDLAKEAGYRYFTLPSAWRADRARGEYADMTARMGSSNVIRYRGRHLGRRTTREFLWFVHSWSGSGFYWCLARSSILARLAFSYVRPGQ